MMNGTVWIIEEIFIHNIRKPISYHIIEQHDNYHDIPIIVLCSFKAITNFMSQHIMQAL